VAGKQTRAYSLIRDRVLDGTYGPGYRLVIDELAREFGMSALPVREAIRRLEAEGWVDFRRNVGARVTAFDPRRWIEEMQVLAVLEGYATAVAAPHLSRDQLARATEINRDMEDAFGDHELSRVSTLNREFHFTLYEQCPNRSVVDYVRQTWDRLEGMRRSLSFYIAARGIQSVAEHDQLLDLLRTDPTSFAGIEAAARAHKLRTIAACVDTDTATALPEGLVVPEHQLSSFANGGAPLPK